MQTTLRTLTAAWPLAMFLLLPALTRAETAVQAWVQRYNDPSNSDDQAQAVVVDSRNNVIVTGYALRGSSLGFSDDYVTIQYSSAGVPLWTNTYDGSVFGADSPRALAVDGSNNVIVTGGSWGAGAFDYATIKYSGAGAPLWTNRYNGPGNGWDQVNAMAVDGSNNVLVTGCSYSSTGFSNSDYATIKYSSAGVPLWTNRYHGPAIGVDHAQAIVLDTTNNVIVTGYSVGSGGDNDYATIQYSSAGVPLWTNRYNGSGDSDDRASAVVVDGSGNVILTGYSTGSGSGYDYATIKYSSAGIPLWTNCYNGPGNGNDYAQAIALDCSSNVIVTGSTIGSRGYYDYATIKYSSAGVPLWTNRYLGPGTFHNYAQAMALGASNSVIVTGRSWGSGSSYDYATLKYSSAGVPLWTNRYNGPANGDDYSLAVAADRNGNVIVTGSSGSGGISDFATIRYICVPEPVITDIQLTNGTFQMRVDGVLQPGTLVIEAGTNLVAWAPVFTNTTPTNVLFYIDPEASNSPARFFRAFQFP